MTGVSVEGSYLNGNAMTGMSFEEIITGRQTNNEEKNC